MPRVWRSESAVKEETDNQAGCVGALALRRSNGRQRFEWQYDDPGVDCNPTRRVCGCAENPLRSQKRRALADDKQL